MSDWFKRLASPSPSLKLKMDSTHGVNQGSSSPSSLHSNSTTTFNPTFNSNPSDLPPSVDKRAVLDSFKNHWLQAWSIMRRKTVGPSSVHSTLEALDESVVLNSDDITTIINHFDQMTTLLIEENSLFTLSDNSPSTPISMSPLLDYLLMESILDKIFDWSLNIGQYTSIMKLEQLKLYELLISQLCHQTALFQKPLVRPLMQLLATCGSSAPVEVEKRLVILLNTLCVCLSQYPRLLELFFVPQKNDSQVGLPTSPVSEITSSPQLISKFSYLNKPESRFLMFSLLIPFVHREGAIGQQARDGLLLIMSLARRNDSIGTYIAESSNFCPVLATGLSGLYSSLPRKLSNEALMNSEWHQIAEEDIKESLELQVFLSSLEFCNAVVQVTHPLVKQQLLELVYQGFLVSVIGPALHQDTLDVPLEILEKAPKYSNSLEEIVATTAYLELFLRKINEPALLQVFLKFICIETFDGQRILDTLIGRLRAKTKLGVLTIVLFRTLLDLNCEDVMLELVLKYLMQLKPSTKNITDLNDIKNFHESAQKFTSLTPKCCYCVDHNISAAPLNLTLDSLDTHLTESGDHSFDFMPSLVQSPSTISSQSYLDYLSDAYVNVKRCRRACKQWSTNYDFVQNCPVVSSPTHHPRMDTSPMDSGIFLNNTNSDATQSTSSGEVQDVCQRLSKHGANPDEADRIGPFLSNLLDRLSEMPTNDVYTNLQLTGLISRLGTYPQPILRAYIFSDNCSYSNSRTVWSVLVNVKDRIEYICNEIPNLTSVMTKAQNFFKVRDEKILLETVGPIISSGSLSRKNSVSSDSFVVIDSIPKEHKRRSIASFLFGSRPKTAPPPQSKLKPVNNGQGYRYINKQRSRTEESGHDKLEETENTVLAAIVMEEFLKELAAISQEQSLQDFDLCV